MPGAHPRDVWLARPTVAGSQLIHNALYSRLVESVPPYPPPYPCPAELAKKFIVPRQSVKLLKSSLLLNAIVKQQFCLVSYCPPELGNSALKDSAKS